MREIKEVHNRKVEKVYVIPLGEWFNDCSFEFDLRGGEMGYVPTIIIDNRIVLDKSQCIIYHEV